MRLEDIEHGTSDFWTYCKLKSPTYFTEDKPHLKTLATVLQNFYEGKLLNEQGVAYRKIMINMPPRHGKSRTLTNFCQWILGKNQNERIIECSYSDEAAGDFAKYTRDGITEQRNNADLFVFSDFFRNVKLKFGSKSYYKWALEGQHFNYLGAGIRGQITGKGGTLLLVDDAVKNAEEAFNEDALQKTWDWYTNTFLSRGDTEDTGNEPLEIIVMTRWSNKDLCGRILESDKAKDWYVLKMKAYDEASDTMLCERTLSKKRYLDLQSEMQPEIFWANYLQETVETKGLLYKSFKTYTDLPKDTTGKYLFDSIDNYTDTADEGDNNLVSINYGVYNGEAYVLDVIYTKEGMEVTEEQTAKFLFDWKVNKADIESNNGGRGFARNVKRILEEKHKSTHTIIRWFHQSENKVARINSNSAWVQNHIYFPVNWKDRCPAYFKAMNTYLKAGKNKHDDAPDCTTGIAERVSKGTGFYLMNQRAA